MRLLVCGDRNWSNYEFILKRIKELKPAVIIHGAATGADSLAGKAATELGISVEEYPADWSIGRRAGPIRNSRMLKEGNPDYVLAFHPKISESKGTRDMLHKAMRVGIPTELLSGR